MTRSPFSLVATVVGILFVLGALLVVGTALLYSYDCPPTPTEVSLRRSDSNGTHQWLELNESDVNSNGVVKALFDAWYGNSSDDRVWGDTNNGVRLTGTDSEMRSVWTFLDERGANRNGSPIHFRGDSFWLSVQVVVC